MLRPEPDTRYASALALARSLGEVIASSGQTADATSVSELVEACSGVRPPEQAEPLLVASRDDFDPAHTATRLLAPAPVDEEAAGLAVGYTRSIIYSEPIARRRQPALVAAALVAVLAIGLGLTLWWTLAQRTGQDRHGSEHGAGQDAAGVLVGADLDAGAVDAGDPVASAAAGEDGSWDLNLELDDAGPSDRSRQDLRRSGRKRPPRVRPRGEGSVAPTRSEPARTGEDLPALQPELERQVQRLRERGVRRHDSPAVDALRDRVVRAMKRRDGAAARDALAQLDRAVDKLFIDRAFVERKVLRLQRALARAGREAEFEAQRREILEHAVRNRFVEANAALNRLFEAL